MNDWNDNIVVQKYSRRYWKVIFETKNSIFHCFLEAKCIKITFEYVAIENRFLPKIFINYYGRKFLWLQNHFLENRFLPNIFKIFFMVCKVITSKIGLHKQFFWLKIFWVQNDFLENRFAPNIFIKILWSKFFLGAKWFSRKQVWTKNFHPKKCLMKVYCEGGYEHLGHALEVTLLDWNTCLTSVL